MDEQALERAGPALGGGGSWSWEVLWKEHNTLLPLWPPRGSVHWSTQVSDSGYPGRVSGLESRVGVRLWEACSLIQSFS